MPKGTSITGTREWAVHSENIIYGCANGCLYCYARAHAARFGRTPVGGWTEEVVKTNRVGRHPLRKGRIMYPTAHDLTVANQGATVPHLMGLLRAGNEVLVVSKPTKSVIQRICQEAVPYRDKLTFRFTIGAWDDDALSFWEPGAPRLADRVASLLHAHQAGYQTSVSMEPLLVSDLAEVSRLVVGVKPFVTDSIWLGKMNSVSARLSLNGFWDDPNVRERASLLVESQDEGWAKGLYELFRQDPMVKYKDSLKKVLGLDPQTEAGQDV